MNRFVIGPLCVALLLAGGVVLTQIYFDGPQVQTSKDVTDCSQGQKLCIAATGIVRDLKQLSFDLRRRHFTKQALPVLKLYMSDGALRKIQNKRQKALAKRTPILIRDGDDWVDATALTDNGDKQERARVSLRLKGDWGDHLNDPARLSFRIKVKGGDYLFGLKRFSIQNPGTRNYALEPLLLDMMRESGVLAPRYFFVDVRINDVRIGIMALEEHFSKELLESQGRREGPILAMDEDLLWRQWDQNRNHSERALEEKYGQALYGFVNFLWSRDIPIREFQQRPYAPGTVASNNTLRGQSLLRDYLDGRVALEDAFDLKRVAQWWVLTNMWNGCHGHAWHNVRYYFNPVTDKLEPVAFDNEPHPEEFSFCREDWVADFLSTRTLLASEAFVSQAIDFISALRDRLNDPAYGEALTAKLETMNAILALSDSDLPTVRVAQLQLNLRLLVDRVIEIQGKPKPEKASPKPAEAGGRSHVIGEELQRAGAKPVSHLVAFGYVDDRHVTVELRNLSGEALQISAMTRQEPAGRKKNLVSAPLVLAGLVEGGGEHHRHLSFPLEVLRAGAELSVMYRVGGKEVEQKVPLQFRRHDPGIDHDLRQAARRISSQIRVVPEKKEVRFPAGAYTFLQSYVLPKGWRLTLAPGASLSFQNGALLRLEGPLIARGTAERPIHITIQPDRAYRKMGLWGGLFVVQSDAASVLEHVRIKGEAAPLPPNRQDYRGLTGCVTFYESAVEMRQVHFSGLPCEDALNIIRSPFSVTESRFENVRADALDSDFSTGQVRSIRFVRIGNDAIDVSGTQLMVEDVVFEGIGDKALSVGEMSHLYGKAMIVRNARTGIASKDLSEAEVRDVQFEDMQGTALMAYIKKKEYGPARLSCSQCRFRNVPNIDGGQAGSRIVINGEPVVNKPYSQAQLAEAGYVDN